jgi:site-specific DNA recombinase
MGVRTKGDFEPVVEPHLFDRAQKVLAGNGRRAGSRKSENPDFPLRHFVRCGQCDNPLTGSWSGGRSKKYAYYHCHKCRLVRIPRSQLEMEFLDVVRALRPSPVCLRLFETIVRDVWKKRQRKTLNEMAITERRINRLKRRLIRLDESYACNHSVDRQSYVPLRDKLRNELQSAEMEPRDVHSDDFELEVALGASREVLSRGAELWKASIFAQKTKLQAAIFPDGLSHDGEKFRTATTSFIFKELMNKEGNEGKMASLKRPHEERAPGVWEQSLVVLLDL